jgi:hypothetical protein
MATMDISVAKDVPETAGRADRCMIRSGPEIEGFPVREIRADFEITYAREPT